MMNTPISLQTLIESIEAISLEDQALLFEQLYRRRIEKQRQENPKTTDETTEAISADNTPATSNSNEPQNPLLKVPATLKNNPLFDEVLGYMEAYRRELDKETEALLETFGAWEDDRTTEEIVKEIYASRTLAAGEYNL